MEITPNSGGTYRVNPDGSTDLVTPPTGERPCKCRPPDPVPAAEPADAPAPPKPFTPQRRSSTKSED